jgi:hypothetical protein
MTPPKEEGAEEPTHKQEESTITWEEGKWARLHQGLIADASLYSS